MRAQSYCLQAHYIPADHTGMNFQDALSQTLSNWEFDATKVVALMTDSGSNIFSASTFKLAMNKPFRSQPRSSYSKGSCGWKG